jgi:hypothetical protein
MKEWDIDRNREQYDAIDSRNPENWEDAPLDEDMPVYMAIYESPQQSDKLFILLYNEDEDWEVGDVIDKNNFQYVFELINDILLANLSIGQYLEDYGNEEPGIIWPKKKQIIVKADNKMFYNKPITQIGKEFVQALSDYLI